MVITIIIPNFNKGAYLDEMFESILTQTWRNWEAIVVDDNSTDDSLNIIKKYVAIDSRIHLVTRNREPKGGSVCRNIGIEKSQGDYIIFFDSDDLMTPGCLQERCHYINQYCDLDFAIFPVGTFHHKIGDNSMIWLPKNGNHLNKFLRHDLPWNIMSPIWKTKFVKKELKQFDESFSRLQDVEFHTRALLVPNVKYKIANQTIANCFYRINQLCSSQNYIHTLQKNGLAIAAYLRKFEVLLQSENPKRQLRGTLMSFLTQVNYSREQYLIKESDYRMLISIIYKQASIAGIFSNKSLIIFKAYSKLYQFGFWRIKGFNFIFKKVIIYL